MQLSLTDAATRMGLTLRQIRYLIKTERLLARKVGGRWTVEESDLPVDPARDHRRQARAARFGPGAPPRRASVLRGDVELGGMSTLTIVR